MNNEFDERQLYLRGKIFCNGFLVLLIYLFIDAFMKSNGINLVEGMWGNILIIVSVSAYCMIDMVLREVIDLEKQSNRIFYATLGIVGVVLFVWGIADLIINHGKLISGQSLSEQGARLLMDFAWILVGIAHVYKLKYICNVKEN